MNQGAPTCPKCGGLSINPNDAQCRFCGTALNAYAPPGYGAPPPQQGYGGPQAFQPPPQNYGAPPGYGAPQGYAPPQQGYGAPNPYAPQPYQQNPYGPQYPPVQGFGGGYGQQINRGWGGNGWSTFLWVRLAIAGVFIALSLMGACISAISNN